MKNLVYALVGAGFMIACQPSDQPEISGMLTGIESDTLLVQSFPVNDRDSRRTDTIAMQNGSFAFNLGDSVLKQVYIYGKPSVKPNEDGSIPAISMKAVNFLLLPGQPIKISGSLDEYKLEGGSFYDDYNEVLEDCKAYSHKIDSLNVVCMDMEKKGIPGDSIRKVYASAKEWYGNILKIKSDSKKWVDADVTVKLPFEIDILSTGKSDFILIEAEGKFIIIDCGFYENSTKIKEFLNYKDVEEIEYLILSHNDKDHIGGAPIILDNFKINNLVQADYEKNTVQYKNYIEAVERNELNPILLHSNIITNINGAKITIYPAIKDTYDKSNDYSIIVGVDYGKYRFLFTGDAEDERMKEFIEEDTGNYTFLKMAHHGIYNDEVGKFLESVSPSYAAITCSYFMYPDRKLISLLNEQKIKTFYTSSGDISIKSDGENIYFIQKSSDYV